MKNGITHLIHLIENGNGPKMEASTGEFCSFLREGIKTEPEKFSNLVEALEARLKRACPELSPEQIRQITLSNLSVFALMADKEYESVMFRAATRGIKAIQKGYDNPKEYGAAMNAFADYVGERGASLRKFIVS